MEVQKSSLLQDYIQRVNNSALQKSAAQNNNFQVPNQLTPEKFEAKNEKKSQKKKIAKIALLSATAVSVAAGIFAAIRYRGKFPQAADNIRNFFISKGQTAKEQTEKLAQYENGSNNLTNIKDAYTRKYLSKIPFYDKFDKVTSNLYRKILKGTMVKNYKNVLTCVDEADKALLKFLDHSDIDSTKATRLREIILKKSNSLKNFASKDEVLSRIDKIDASMEGIDKEGINKIRSLKEKGIKSFKELLKKSVSDEKLQQAGKEHSNLIKSYFPENLTEKEAEELKEFISHIEDKSVLNKLNKANKTLKKTINKESADMFGKLRDINFGCAPTDILGILGTTGLLGLYTAQADTKEEKVKVTLTTGMPLLVSLGTTVFATTKMVNGFKSLALGATTGFVASTLGKLLNKKYQKSHNSENQTPTIVTFEDYTNRVKEFSKNFQI